MRRLRRTVGWLAVGVSAGYLVWVGVEHLGTLRGSVRWDSATAAGLGAAVGFYGLTLALGTLAWTILLHGLGGRLSWPSALRLVLRSNVAKYLPGNVGHLAGRVVLARRAEVPAAAVLASLVWEALLTVTAGILFAAASAPRSLAQLLAADDRGKGLLAALVVGAVTVSALFAAWTWYRSGRREPKGLARGGTGGGMSLWRVLASLALLTVNFAVLGGAGLALARGALPLSPSPYWLLAGAFAVAWVAGFVVPGAPGGLGVREAVLVAELGPILGEGEALTLALLLRLATVLGDGLGFLVAAAWRQWLGLRSGEESI